MFCPKYGKEKPGRKADCSRKCKTGLGAIVIVFICFIIAGFYFYWQMKTNPSTPQATAELFINYISRQNYEAAYKLIDTSDVLEIDNGEGSYNGLNNKNDIIAYFTMMNKHMESHKKPFGFANEPIVSVYNTNGKPLYQITTKQTNNSCRISKIKRTIY